MSSALIDRLLRFGGSIFDVFGGAGLSNGLLGHAAGEDFLALGAGGSGGVGVVVVGAGIG